MKNEKSQLKEYSHCYVLRPQNQEEFIDLKRQFDDCDWVRNHEGCEVYLATHESGHNGDLFGHTLIYRKHPPRAEGV